MFGWKTIERCFKFSSPFWCVILVINCWTNPIIRPHAECLVKIPNYFCPKDDQFTLWELFILLSLYNPVSISNLSNNSLVQTGFIVGKANPEVSLVSITLDNLFESVVTVNNGTWRYALPARALTGTHWQLGTKHSISIQGIGEHGPVGLRKNINVTKGTNQDTNGDGFPDFYVTATLGQSSTGYAFIYLSNENTGVPSNLPNTIITDGVTGTFFGSSIGAGDFNGDGYADMIVGSQAYSPFLGRSYIFLSLGSNGIQNQNLNSGGLANTIFSGVNAGGRLGAFTVGGDVNNDGYDDAIFSSPWNDEAFIFYSQGTNGIATQNTTTASLTYIPGANDNFGTKTAIGDINGDGYIDMVISASTYNASQGRIYIYISNAGILPPTPQGYLEGPTSPSPGCTFTGGCGFGTSLVLSDLNGDHCADLSAGGPGFNTNQGIVFLFHSNCSSTTPFESTPNSFLVGPSNGSCASNVCNFGSSLSVGDVNADGYPELLVGSINASGGKGSVYLFPNNNGNFTNVDLSLGGSAISTLVGSGSGFSQSIKLEDINGDGLADIFVSAPASNTIYHYRSFPIFGPGNIDLSIGQTPTLILSTNSGQTLGSAFAMNHFKFHSWHFD
ncbi:FG-GAP repeat protein [Leptospira sp. 96542]|nr:FG-GAP repeat protein [Leptospira sp. 96542]